MSENDKYPAQIIRVKTESWIDSANQLHFKKTIRQMRSLTNGKFYAFESELLDCGICGFTDIDFSGMIDGFYELVCDYETDEYGICDNVNYHIKPLPKPPED